MYITNTLEALDQARTRLAKIDRQFEILSRCFAGFDERTTGYLPHPGHFSYIPLGLEEFTESLVDLEDALVVDKDFADPKQRYRPLKYLEVGCGIGRNLFILLYGSDILIREAKGIEISMEYVIQARQLFNLHEQALHGDAMTHDYRDYDVIYFSRPFSNDRLERKFERRLIDQLKPGGYVIGHLNSLLDTSKDLTPVTPFSKVYKKRKGRRKGKAKR
jgi:SAM-dependent methyltransferase